MNTHGQTADSAEAPFCNMRIAFTGRLLAMPRREAHILVRRGGGEPTSAVTRRTGILVVGAQGWPVLADGTISRKLADAEKLRKQGHPIEILPEREFIARATGEKQKANAGISAVGLEQACRMLDMEPEAVQRCRQFGLIRSQGDRLDFQDLVSLRAVAGLIRQSLSPEAVARGLNRLAGILPDIERPLAQVRLVLGAGGELLAELNGRITDARGQLLFDFSTEGPRRPARAVRMESQAAAREGSAEELFKKALDLENRQECGAAETHYLQALEIDPLMVEAHFNLGNLLLGRGDLKAAQKHFRQAAAVDSEIVSAAWYNLGYVLGEQKRYSEAVRALETALEYFPEYADALFNLAYFCYEIGRKSAAARYWQAFLRHDDESEWAEAARRYLKGLQ